MRWHGWHTSPWIASRTTYAQSRTPRRSPLRSWGTRRGSTARLTGAVQHPFLRYGIAWRCWPQLSQRHDQCAACMCRQHEAATTPAALPCAAAANPGHEQQARQPEHEVQALLLRARSQMELVQVMNQ